MRSASLSELKKAVSGADMVFILAGMGGGTGTGSAPVVAEIAMALSSRTVVTNANLLRRKRI